MFNPKTYEHVVLIILWSRVCIGARVIGGQPQIVSERIVEYCEDGNQTKFVSTTTITVSVENGKGKDAEEELSGWRGVTKRKQDYNIRSYSWCPWTGSQSARQSQHRIGKPNLKDVAISRLCLFQKQLENCANDENKTENKQPNGRSAVRLLISSDEWTIQCLASQGLLKISYCFRKVQHRSHYKSHVYSSFWIQWKRRGVTGILKMWQ